MGTVKQQIPQTQKYALIAILAAGFLVALYMFVIAPMRESRDKLNTELEELRGKGNIALAEISNIQKRRENHEILSNLVNSVTNRYVVRQVLGSYPMEQEIYRLVAGTDIKINSCSTPQRMFTPEKPPTAPVAKSGPPKKLGANVRTPHFFDRIQMDVIGESSYLDLINLLKTLESDNPFCGVVELSISAVQNIPTRHRFSMKLEWPVDAEPIVKSVNKK